jgi:hypothetical protein
MNEWTENYEKGVRDPERWDELRRGGQPTRRQQAGRQAFLRKPPSSKMREGEIESAIRRSVVGMPAGDMEKAVAALREKHKGMTDQEIAAAIIRGSGA